MEKKINKNLIAMSAVLAVTIIALAVFVAFALTDHVFWLDKFNMFVAKNRNNFSTNFFKVFTHVGSFITLAILVLVCAILLWFVAKKKRMCVFYLACFGITAITNLILKKVIERPRPEHLMIIEETGYSFPSGHSMMSFVFFALAIHFVYVAVKNKWLKWLLISACAVIIGVVGFSRIYLGVHYLTDVLAGWLISLAITCVFIILYNTKLFSRLNDKVG